MTSRRPILAVVALAALLSTTGCFTVIGTTVGALSEPSKKPSPPAPTEMAGPPGGSAVVFAPSRQGRDVDTGMSSTTKGFLIGGAIDLALVGLAVLALSQASWDWCSEDGCSD
jgi:hypothetical protein